MASEPARPRGLGHGLALLLRDQRPLDEVGEGRRLVELPIERIVPNPRQPRARIDEEAFAELVASVRRDGVVQPVLVRELDGRFELIAGERRWRAAQAAGLARVPALVREADERTSLALALVENVVRTDLTAVEQARAYARLADEFGLSHAEIAASVGRSRSAIANAVRLLELPDDVLDAVGRGDLSEGHGRAILQVSDHDARRRLGALAASRGLSVRQTEARARRLANTPPRARRAAGPRWFDADLANGAVEGIYRAFSLDARVVGDGEACRVEIRIRSADELARLVERLDSLAP